MSLLSIKEKANLINIDNNLKKCYLKLLSPLKIQEKKQMKKLGITKLILLTMTLLISGNYLLSQNLDLIPGKSPNEPRILTLMIAADQGYQEWVPNWKEEITNLTNEASMHLEIQTALKIKIVALENWQRKTNGSQDWKLLLLELSEAFPRTKQANFDVVMGLTSDSNSHGANVPRGCFLINCRHSYFPNGYKREIYFWLSDFSRAKIFPSLILHELGHIFGCGHGLDQRYVMYGYAGSYAMIFCKENIEIIKKNKWRKFPIVPDKN